MLSRNEYIQISLENNLFWLRIMKEHAIFIESVLPPPLKDIAQQADRFKQDFEKLLKDAIKIADGVITREALDSGQYFTEFTDESERLTQEFTGIAIDRSITHSETLIKPFLPEMEIPNEKENTVSLLNHSIINKLSELLKFKADLFNSQVSCNAKSLEYTSIIEHVLDEGSKYMEILMTLEVREMPPDEILETPQEEFFWTMIMEEHAKVMRGKFDPVEIHFYKEADRYAKIFERLLTFERHEGIKEGIEGKPEERLEERPEEMPEMPDMPEMQDDMPEMPDMPDMQDDMPEEMPDEMLEENIPDEYIYEENESVDNSSTMEVINVFEETNNLRDFKAFTTRGIIECKVSTVMLPLFTDHLMREANHFIRLMEQS